MATHVFDTMGTTVSLRFAGTAPASSVLEGVEATFRAFDQRFSLYLADSELSRVNRSELSLTRASTALRDEYAEALEWSRKTGGAFTPHRPDGVIDLSGTVKARAMDAAARALEAAGERNWLLGVGGDILSSGSLDGAPWRAGVVDPEERAALLCAVDLTGRRRALATSGTAERGEHIWRSGDVSSPTRYRQVSVLAPDILTADVLATAFVAAGPSRFEEMLAPFEVDVLTVDASGRLTATAGFQHAQGLTAA